MKDLRKEIEERLNEAELKKIDIQKQLDSLQLKVDSLKLLLQDEESRWNEQQPLPGLNTTTIANAGRSPFTRFIIECLTEGPKVKRK